jgi:carbonic anhydrase
MLSSKTLALALCAGLMISSCKETTKEEHPAEHAAEHKTAHVAPATPDEALALLKDGNKRFLDGKTDIGSYKEQIAATKDDQHPHSIILSCMDSRVPPEAIFDQGLGNIFVARVAGNIEDADMLGSMEYATKVKGTKLIVVMGHSHCGAVKGSIDNAQLGNLTQLVDHIKPAIKGDTAHKEAMIEETVKNNVKLTMTHITEKSALIADLVKENKVKIVGAYYDIATGKVDFME